MIMKKLLQIIPILLVVVGAMMLFEQPAYAYADPGTGLLAIQAVGSAFVATGWYLRRKILAFFRKESTAPGQLNDYTPREESESSTLS